jgi:hypothetical protein
VSIILSRFAVRGPRFANAVIVFSVGPLALGLDAAMPPMV